MNSGIGPQIPESLRQLNQWAVYGPDKKPYRAQGLFADNRPIPWRPTDQNGNDTLRSIIEAEAHCRVIGGLFGPAFRMDARNGIVCFDIDDPNKARRGAAYDDLSAHDKEEYISMLHERNEMILRAFEGSGAYIEQSVSGKGFHILCEAVLPEGVSGYNMRGGGSIFTGDQFIYMTGGYGSVVNCQAIVNQLIMWFGANHEDRLQHFFPVEKLDVAIGSLLDLCETHGRQVNLEDDAVVQRLALVNKKTNAAYLGQYDGDHSKAVRDLIGDLDKITGNVGQVERLVLGSNLLRMHPYTARGEDRAAKWRRLIPSVLAKCRPSNDSLYLKRAEDERTARELQAKVSAGNAALVDDSVDERAGLPLAAQVFNRIIGEDIAPRFYDYTAPPMGLGVLVRDLSRKSAEVNEGLTLSAVASQVSALLCPYTFTIYGESCHINSMYIAGSGDGKSEGMFALVNLLTKVATQLQKEDLTISCTEPLDKVIGNIFRSSSVSAQHIYARMQDQYTRTLCITEDEARGFLSKIAADHESKRETLDTALQTIALQAYDHGKHKARYTKIPGGIYSDKRGDADVPYGRVVLALTTVGRAVRPYLNQENIDLGLFPRLVYTSHKASTGVRVQSRHEAHMAEISPESIELCKRLIKDYVSFHSLLPRVKDKDGNAVPAHELDEGFRQAEALIEHRAVRWHDTAVLFLAGIEKRAGEVKRATGDVEEIAAGGGAKYPVHYAMLNRAFSKALRLCCVVAACGDGVVTLEVAQWCAAYIVRNDCALCHEFDVDRVAETHAQDQELIVECMKSLVARKRAGSLAARDSRGVTAKGYVSITQLARTMQKNAVRFQSKQAGEVQRLIGVFVGSTGILDGFFGPDTETVMDDTGGTLLPRWVKLKKGI